VPVFEDLDGLNALIEAIRWGSKNVGNNSKIQEVKCAV